MYIFGNPNINARFLLAMQSKLWNAITDILPLFSTSSKYILISNKIFYFLCHAIEATKKMQSKNQQYEVLLLLKPYLQTGI